MSKTKYPYIVKKGVGIYTYGDGRLEYVPFVILREKWFLFPSNERHKVCKAATSALNAYFLTDSVSYYTSFISFDEAVSALEIAIKDHFKELESTEVISYVEKYI